MTDFLKRLNGARLVAFDTPNEGNPGGDDAAALKAAADKAAADKAAADAADAAAVKAKADSDAADLAAKGGDPEKVQLAKEKADLLAEVMDKKTKLKAAQAAEAAATKALEAYGGIDPKKVQELLKKEADAEKAAAEAKGDFDRVKAMMADEHAKELKTVTDQLEAERADRAKDRSLIDELTVGNAFGMSVYIKENLVLSPEKTRTLYGAHFEMKDGRMVGYNKPAGAANRDMLVTSAGEPMAFDEALTRIIEADPDKKSVLRAKQKPGSGSTTTPPVQKPDTGKADPNALYGRSRIAASFAR